MYLLAMCIVSLTATSAIEPHIEQLENGLTAIIAEDHALPLVSVQLWYGVGSAMDPPEYPGLCHVARALLEDSDDAALKLRAAGLQFWSWTDWDAVTFSTLLPPESLDYVLGIEARRAWRAIVDDQLLRDAIQSAARAGENVVRAEAYERRNWLMPPLFGDHPYGHPPMFVAPALTDIDTNTVQAFLDRWFVTGGATLVVYGDVDHEAVAKRVRVLFAELPKRMPPRRKQVPRPESEPIPPLALTGQNAMVDIAWVTPPAGSYENPAIAVLVAHLANASGGPLNQRLRPLGCMPVGWYWRRGQQASTIRIAVMSSQGMPWADEMPPTEADAPRDPIALRDRIAEVVHEVLEHAVDEPLAPVELRRARALALQKVQPWGDSLSAAATQLGWQQVVTGDAGGHARLVELIETVTVDDVRIAARRLLAARTTALVTSPILDSAAATAFPEPLKGVPPERLDGPAALRLLATYADGAPSPAAPARSPRVDTRQIADGVKLTVCRIPGRASAAVTTLASPRDWNLSMALMGPPTGRFSSEELSEYLSLHGLTKHAARTTRDSGLSSYGPADKAPQMIELHADTMRGLMKPSDVEIIGRAAAALKTSRIWVIVVGGVDIDSVFSTTYAEWSEFETEPPAEAAAERPDWPEGTRATIRNDTDFRDGALSVSLPTRPLAMRTIADRITNAAATWCVGVPEGTVKRIDRRHAWRWHWWAGNLDTEGYLGTMVAPDGACEAIDSLARSIRQMRRGQLGAVEAQQALRLAWMQHLLALDDNAAITRAIIECDGSPWQVDPGSVTVEQLAQALPGMVREAPLSVTIGAGNWSDEQIERLRKCVEAVQLTDETSE